MNPPERISKIEYAMKLAEVAAMRSEDPYRQVGAVAMTTSGVIVATGYNGLPPGVISQPNWWKDKEHRKPFVIHAEQNLCAGFKRGEASVVCVTLQPCPECFRQMVAQGIKLVLYRTPKEKCDLSLEMADLYDVKLKHWPHDFHLGHHWLGALEK